VSDELIEMYEIGESPPKCSPGGLSVKLIDSVSIPGDLMMFVTVKIPREFTRKEAVNKIDAGREWMEPPAVVQMEKGKLKTFFDVYFWFHFSVQLQLKN
jgi:hypothetical protein